MSQGSTTQFLDHINSKFEESFLSASKLAREMGCIEEALLAAKRGFSYNPNSTAMLELFPECTPLVAELRDLIDQYGQLIRDGSRDVSLWTRLGFAYLTLGDFPNAFAAFAYTVGVQPDCADPSFCYAMGIVYAHYHYSDYALQYLRRVLNLGIPAQFRGDVFLRIGFGERSMGNYDAALDALRRAVDAPPNGLCKDDVLFQIAYTHQLRGDGVRASEIFEDLLTRHPRNARLLEQYCWFLYLENRDREGNLEQVSAVIQNALEMHPADPRIRLIAARVAMRQGDMTTAYDHYRCCITYCNDWPFFWCGMGVLYWKNEQMQDAIVAFQRALFLEPEVPEAWLNIGFIFEQQGQLANAMKVCQTGMTKCGAATQNEFKDRINALNTQKQGHRRYMQNYSLIDIDDSKFVSQPEQFANEYVCAAPLLPGSCYGKEDVGKRFEPLTTFPKSLFARD